MSDRKNQGPAAPGGWNPGLACEIAVESPSTCSPWRLFGSQNGPKGRGGLPCSSLLNPHFLRLLECGPGLSLMPLDAEGGCEKLTPSGRTHRHLLEDTLWSPQRPAAATPGQEVSNPTLRSSHLALRFQQFRFPSPWDHPSPLPHCRTRLEASECSWHSPEWGSSAGDGRQAMGTSCPGTTSQPRGWTPHSQFVRLSLILFLPLVSFSV